MVVHYHHQAQDNFRFDRFDFIYGIFHLFYKTFWPFCYTDGKKGQKWINVQDGISPYRAENSSKINNSYMYDYLILKSTWFWNFVWTLDLTQNKLVFSERYRSLSSDRTFIQFPLWWQQGIRFCRIAEKRDDSPSG